MTVQSVTADNAGPLTLDGTRSYVVGHGSVVIVDPGPRDPDHLRALRSAVAGRPVEAVLLTHAHGDHAAGAVAMATEFGALVSASRETLDRLGIAGEVLEDGDCIDWDGGLRLVAVFTPGHSADHVAYLLLPDRDVFTGDLVLGSGTSVILYPDGSMADYFASLSRLAALRPARLWPGHGETVADGATRLAEYRRHRLERARQILAAVKAGAGTVTEIRAAVYGKLPTGLDRAAEASICAHLEHLRSQGEDVPGIDPGFRFSEADG